jgi:hypothetical protein
MVKYSKRGKDKRKSGGDEFMKVMIFPEGLNLYMRHKFTSR